MEYGTEMYLFKVMTEILEWNAETERTVNLFCCFCNELLYHDSK